VAIWFSATVTLVLAITGSFTLIAGASALARLVTYTGVSVATLTLRSSKFPPAAFVLPFGVAIPAAAIAISLATVAGATSDQLKAGALALVAGAAFYVCNAWINVLAGRLAAEKAQKPWWRDNRKLGRAVNLTENA
jgi:basic amino acid/polyamine antiporter, APA family